MGRVFIIKNNGRNEDIEKYAKESYEDAKKTKSRFYNVLPTNEIDFNKMTDYRNNEGATDEIPVIFLINYNKSIDSEAKVDIKDAFIGVVDEVNDHNSIGYKMYVHLVSPISDRAIQSIIDKIDLDFDLDYEPKEYVLISKMESLYFDLYTRIVVANEKKNISRIVDKTVKTAITSCGALPINARLFEETSTTITNGYQLDSERIVKSKAFRRMVDKAQVFSASKGVHFRTRMTHSLEVNEIAKRISRNIGLDAELSEAIALGHDIGHTPFGHQGERTLDRILSGEIDIGIPVSKDLLSDRCFGGFKHNYQSIRILTVLEEVDAAFCGANISVQVLDGIIKHTSIKDYLDIHDFTNDLYADALGLANKHCCTSEGTVVALADEIAQRGHDIDDAFASNSMTISGFLDCLNVGKCDALRKKVEKRLKTIENADRAITSIDRLRIASIVACVVDYFVDSVVHIGEETVVLDEEAERVLKYLEKVIQKRVLLDPYVTRADDNANSIIKWLFSKYYHNPRLLPKGVLKRIYIYTLRSDNLDVSDSAINLCDCSMNIAEEEIKDWVEVYQDKENKSEVIMAKRKILLRAITDYISGMTDSYALQEADRLK